MLFFLNCMLHFLYWSNKSQLDGTELKTYHRFVAFVVNVFAVVLMSPTLTVISCLWTLTDT